MQGDLIVEPQLLFPTTLSEAQKVLLKSAFFLPAKLDAVQVRLLIAGIQVDATQTVATTVVDGMQAKAVSTFTTAFTDELHGWSSGLPKDTSA